MIAPPIAVEALPPDTVTAPYGAAPDLGATSPSDVQEGTVAAPAEALAGATAIAPADRIPAAPTTELIALVLPLDEPAFERAASAVRDGFFDAATAAGRSGDCVVIAHGRDGVVGAFERARAKGVRVAVGPLVRDDLKALAAAGTALPWTLALNQLDDGTKLPAAVYSFPLTVESDGRMLARRALAAGARSIDVIEGDSPLMKRLAGAFAVGLTDAGGPVPSSLRFDAAPESLSDLRRMLARNTPDAVLLAVNGERAALLKPFIRGIDAYASGLVFERPTPAVARDLDGVRVVEIPWLLTPDAPQFARLAHREFDSASLARLYAFGLDAYRIAASFQDGPPARFDADGATGHITLTRGREFQREGRLGVYRDGVLVPLDAGP